DCHRRRDLACRVTAHAIGDDEETLPRLHERRVLVMVAHHPDVGDEPGFEDHASLLSTRAHESAAIKSLTCGNLHPRCAAPASRGQGYRRVTTIGRGGAPACASRFPCAASREVATSIAAISQSTASNARSSRCATAAVVPDPANKSAIR